MACPPRIELASLWSSSLISSQLPSLNFLQARQVMSSQGLASFHELRSKPLSIAKFQTVHEQGRVPLGRA